MKFDYDKVPTRDRVLESTRPTQHPGVFPKDGEYERLLCKCGKGIFQVFGTDSYETSVRCEACGHWNVVHSG